MTNIKLTKGNSELYNIQYVQIVYIQYICIYLYSLSSITAVSLIVEKPLNPPNTIIQLVVGVTLQTERECHRLLVTFFGILTYKRRNIFNFLVYYFVPSMKMILYLNTVLCIVYLQTTPTNYKPHPKPI